ncbi:MAG: lycopene cyclase domain-containing protein [Candidatus Omnitrophota bacterium]|jgi:lycopene cyclase domain-containing protein
MEMKEYTLLAIISLFFTIYLDRASGVNLLKRKMYYLFILIILFFKLLVNGYLTYKAIVIYNSEFFLGFRIGSIPLEDFFFGFSMVTLSIIFWEYFRKETAC